MGPVSLKWQEGGFQCIGGHGLMKLGLGYLGLTFRSPNPYVEILSLEVMVLGGGVSGTG